MYEYSLSPELQKLISITAASSFAPQQASMSL